MRDEYNHGSGNQNAAEYSMPVEDQCPIELLSPVEQGEVEEFRNAAEYNDEIEEPHTEEEASDGGRRKKKKLMAYLITAAIAVVTVTNAVNGGTPERAPQAPLTVERDGLWGYDNSVFEEFPTMPNPMPNGPVTLENGMVDFVLDEEFLICVRGDESYALLAGANRSYLPVSEGTEEMYYDPESNTLYLENCDLDYINANMLGNGFTIHVKGVCHIGAILSWGFHHGGSVTLAGEDGTLYLNRDAEFPYGIEVRGEDSMSAVFVDEMDGLYIGGSIPILVTETNMPYGVYWKTGAMQCQSNLYCGEYDHDASLRSYEYHCDEDAPELVFLPGIGARINEEAP